jgi:hypothetical protein
MEISYTIFSTSEKRGVFLKLKESFSYRRVTVPKGYVSNGNSIPKWLQKLFSWFLHIHENPEAFFVHDFLYGVDCPKSLRNRKKADIAYRKVAIKYGYNKFKAWVIYIILRLFGWWAYIGE